MDHYCLKRGDRLIWGTILTVSAVDIAAIALGPFTAAWGSFSHAAIGCMVLLGAGWFYTKVRKDVRIATALTGTSQIAAFAAVGAPLSYIAASANLPLRDAAFMTWDRELGFDWNAWLEVMNNHPGLHMIFALAYASFFAQTTTTVIALAFSGNVLRLRIFTMAFCLTTIATIGVSALAPAQGVWGHLGLNAQDYPAIMPVTRELHLPVFHGLRDGTMRILTAEGAQGIITFPSLHAALGLLFIVALWPVPYLRWIALALNLVMIASTPVDGGHYFVDGLAGMIIACFCWAMARRLLDQASADTAIPIAQDSPPLMPAAPASAASVISSLSDNFERQCAKT